MVLSVARLIAKMEKQEKYRELRKKMKLGVRMWRRCLSRS